MGIIKFKIKVNCSSSLNFKDKSGAIIDVQDYGDLGNLVEIPVENLVVIPTGNLEQIQGESVGGIQAENLGEIQAENLGEIQAENLGEIPPENLVEIPPENLVEVEDKNTNSLVKCLHVCLSRININKIYLLILS